MKRILLLCASVAITLFAFSQSNKISLEDLNVHGTFRSSSVRGITSLNDGEHYSTLERGGKIAKYSYSTGERVGVLFDADDFEVASLKQIANYELSVDEKKILLATDIAPVYRHSFTAYYYVYDIEKNEVFPLSNNGNQMLATFSPDGSMVAFVRNNNIFIKNLISSVEQQITTDGLFNHIINGAADWVYEEEFRLVTGMQWSPDSKNLAFYRFDEGNVKLFHMPTYMNELYPANYSFKYPKAGEENSVVTIHVYSIDKKEIRKMDVGEETDQYIARIKWTVDSDKLCMVRLNRLQNRIDLLMANPITGESTTLFTETNKRYIEEPTDSYPLFTEDGKFFIVPSERDGFNHLYLYSMNGELVKQLTKGNNEVIEVYGCDTKKKRVYYQAFDGSPMQTAVYYSSFDGKKSVKLSESSGTNLASFSDGFKYYIHFYSSISTPTQVTLHNAKGKKIRVLEDNAELSSTLADYEIPKKEFFSFKTSEGVELNGYMVKPIGFSEEVKYPVFLNQYSGPNSRSVVDRFSVSWDEYLASEGYLVVCVDGRGTGGRGEEFRKMTQGQLGHYESIDQIETGKYLQGLPYVDKDRIGIWGWSYGGYMSSLCLFKAPDVFSMAIAVAPVANWRYYDSVYTERFMGLPQDNANGYDDNSPINHVDGLQGKLLLVHGTADDNVHVQNTIEMAEKLIQASKQFDMMLYPDKNHSIYGENTRMHLYTLLTNYVKANL